MNKIILSLLTSVFLCLVIFLTIYSYRGIFFYDINVEIPLKNEEKFKRAISHNLREEQKIEDKQLQEKNEEVVYTAPTVRTQTEEMMRVDNLNFRGDPSKLSYKPGEYRSYEDFEGKPMWLSPSVKSLGIFKYGELYTIEGELYTVTPDVSNCTPEPCIEILQEGENTYSNIEIFKEEKC